MKKKILIIAMLSFIVFSNLVYAQEESSELSQTEIMSIAANGNFQRKIGSTEEMQLIYDVDNKLTKKYFELYQYYPSTTERNYQGVYFADKKFTFKPNFIIAFDKITGEEIARMGIYNDFVSKVKGVRSLHNWK